MQSGDRKIAADGSVLMRLWILLRKPVQLANMFIEVRPGTHLKTEWDGAAAVAIHKQARPGTAGAAKPMYESLRTQDRQHVSWFGFPLSIHCYAA